MADRSGDGTWLALGTAGVLAGAALLRRGSRASAEEVVCIRPGDRVTIHVERGSRAKAADVTYNVVYDRHPTQGLVNPRWGARVRLLPRITRPGPGRDQELDLGFSTAIRSEGLAAFRLGRDLVFWARHGQGTGLHVVVFGPTPTGEWAERWRRTLVAADFRDGGYALPGRPTIVNEPGLTLWSDPKVLLPVVHALGPPVEPKRVNTRARPRLGSSSKVARRMSPEEAWAAAETFVAALVRTGITSVTVAGSLRRGEESIGDIDVVAFREGRFRGGKRPMPHEVPGATLRSGGARMRTYDLGGVQVNLFEAEPDEAGAMLLHATGSAGFNAMLRTKAKRKGFLLNQYGLWRDKERVAERVASMTEADIFEALGHRWVPPEARRERMAKRPTTEQILAAAAARPTPPSPRFDLDALIAKTRPRGSRAVWPERPVLASEDEARAALDALQAAMQRIYAFYDAGAGQAVGVTPGEVVAALGVLDRYLTRREPAHTTREGFQQAAAEALAGEKVEVYLSDGGYSRIWLDPYGAKRADAVWLGGNSLDLPKERWSRLVRPAG